MIIFGETKISFKFQEFEVNSSIVLIIRLGEKSMEKRGIL